MPPQTHNLIKQQNKRVFWQRGGARPNNARRYAGVEETFIAIDGAAPELAGGRDPIYVQDPHAYGRFYKADSAANPPDEATVTVMFRERPGRIPVGFQDISCSQNFFIVTGGCLQPDDWARGWTDYVEIYEDAQPSGNPDLGARTAWDSDEALEASLEFVVGALYAVGPMSLGDNATAQIDREVIDVVYGSKVQCGNCGPQDNGTNKIYAVTESSGGGSPGLPAEVIYSLDGGGTWAQATITGFGATEDPLAIGIVGNYLIILGADAYYYAELNANTGAPGTFTKVTGGIVGAGSPVDMFVLSPSEVFFVGEAGYIYKLTSVGAALTVVNAGSATTQNLTRIFGDRDKTLMAVGNNGTVVKSVNRGVTWATTTTSPSINGAYAGDVLDEFRYWYGDDAGGLYWTVDGGETWTASALPGTPTAIRDIVFASNSVGYVAYDTAGPAGNLAWTLDGGYSWATGRARIVNVPTTDRINRIAVPEGVHPTTQANYIALAALGANGTDGALLLGAASF